MRTASTFISFEDEFFQSDRRSESTPSSARSASLAQRAKLKREAEALLDALVKERGRAGARIVLGDTALWGVCDALHLVRRLYDLTATGGRGFWVLVVPGLVHKSQPLFNEKSGAIVFSIGGSVLTSPSRCRLRSRSDPHGPDHTQITDAEPQQAVGGDRRARCGNL